MLCIPSIVNEKCALLLNEINWGSKMIKYYLKRDKGDNVLKTHLPEGRTVNKWS